MQLEDRLKICLLAVESRYPEHVIDVNQNIVPVWGEGATGWLASEMIVYLERMNPVLLHKMARLVVDLQCSEIYLLERSEHIPAFVVHCRGKIPARHKKPALSVAH